MIKKIFIKFSLILLILLSTGCFKEDLDIRILKLAGESCHCDYNLCECYDRYTDDFIYIQCADDVMLADITDIMVYCNYGFKADDGKMYWERFPNKFIMGGENESERMGKQEKIGKGEEEYREVEN